MNRYSLAAIAGFTLLAAPAIAQETLSTVIFAGGDNGGALEVAQSFYGRSQAMETAIVDIDNDGSAEIAVKFLDGCDEEGCTTSVLFYSENQWLEVLSHPTEALSLSGETTNGLRQIVTSDNARWHWNETGFRPSPDRGGLIWTAGSQEVDLLPSEAQHSKIRTLSDPKRFSVDLNGDGAMESVVFSISPEDCSSVNLCPVVIHNADGTEAGEVSAIEARVKVHEGVLYSLSRGGFSSFAYDGQRLVLTSRVAQAEIRGQ